MCCTRLAVNAGRQKSRKIRHLGTIAQLCPAISSHVLTIGKYLLNSNISPTCPHNILNFGPLTAEICWRLWGTPANFGGFRVLASLLQRCRSTEVNQTLYGVWPSPRLVHYTQDYIFLGSCPVTEFLPRAKFTLHPTLAFPILAALLHGTRAVGVSESLRLCTRNGTTELSQWAPPIRLGGHHVWHRPTF